jgi:hypothetical protein
MKILHLTLKKKWFDMILSGEKKEEYRELKPYWIKRFGYTSSEDDPEYVGLPRINCPDIICFTNGYGFHRPSFEINVLDWEVGRSKHPSWGGDMIYKQFIFKLGHEITILHNP